MFGALSRCKVLLDVCADISREVCMAGRGLLRMRAKGTHDMRGNAQRNLLGGKARSHEANDHTQRAHKLPLGHQQTHISSAATQVVHLNIVALARLPCFAPLALQQRIIHIRHTYIHPSLPSLHQDLSGPANPVDAWPLANLLAKGCKASAAGSIGPRPTLSPSSHAAAAAPYCWPSTCPPLLQTALHEAPSAGLLG